MARNLGTLTSIEFANRFSSLDQFLVVKSRVVVLEEGPFLLLLEVLQVCAKSAVILLDTALEN